MNTSKENNKTTGVIELLSLKQTLFKELGSLQRRKFQRSAVCKKRENEADFTLRKGEI